MGERKQAEMEVEAAKLKRDNTLWIYKPAQYKELGRTITSLQCELEGIYFLCYLIQNLIC